MGLEKLKFWHWMIIGVLIGVGYGAVKAFYPTETGTEARSRDRWQFEDDLRKNAAVRNLVLHPPIGGQEWLTGEIYVQKNGSPHLPGRRTARDNTWFGRARRAMRTTQPAAAPVDKLKLPEGGQWTRLEVLAAQDGRQSREYRSNVTGPEYLAHLQKEYAESPYAERDLNYRFAWWEVPKFTMGIYGAAGFLVIGVIWPTIVALLMGVGLVQRPEPDAYDLSRFKGGKQPEPQAKPAVTQAQQDQLEALNAKLAAGVADMVHGNTTPEIDHAAEHAAVVKKLENRPLDAAELAAANKSDEPKEYKGEFYPVAKPGAHKK